ncbi:hypothetical protein NX02_13650 [Sphingomonas sanxanigenens DSM 19645 = NX02]|uniref:Uncharacterized protein n=1 Tax=Sphingomonas sanxanigenens DSM 19645 = NX02 TaxID=1123269 RepID=W0ADP0_9SPHN|nr:hypothetical protein NX02_13650 [Sphingomonas sanxanigenens DSM 19645 = NX02]
MDLIDAVDSLRHENDGDGSVLDALIAPLAILGFPEVAVVENLAGLRRD